MISAFRLDRLDCADCAAKMERAIGAMDGVNSAAANFITIGSAIDADDDRINDVIGNAERIAKKNQPDTVIKRA